jgi:hypothetical protein
MKPYNVILSTAYLPTIAWFQLALNAEKVVLEKQENYQKQSYRNRCKILSANGILDLIIPIQHASGKQKISEIQTEESTFWRKQHWQALNAAYGKSAFFLYYKDYLKSIYDSKEKSNLFDLNLELIQWILKCYKTKIEFEFSTEFQINPESLMDERNMLAKGKPLEEELLFSKNYLQVFSEKMPFQPNLSILDLLFNLGPRGIDFLLLPD